MNESQKSTWYHITEKARKLKRYEHRPLESATYIRVLHLQSQLGRDLQCSLEHVDITQADFVALSYVWGNPKWRFRMKVVNAAGEQEGYIPLTTSLHNALSDLRDCGDIQHKVLWADQICINQEDNAEKEIQVAMMGEIYRTAGSVVTYLGPKASRDQQAFALIDQIGQGAANYVDELLIEGFDSSSHLSNVLTIIEAHPGRRGLETIIFGDWLRRLWLIPENILNRNTVMLRGNTTLHWKAVLSIAILVMTQLVGDKRWLAVFPRGLTNLQFSGIFINLYRLRSDLWSSSASKTLPPLLDQLFNFHSSRCSDPRDKVYALLGIASDSSALAIVPDYLIPMENLSTTVSARVIEKSQSLEILEYARPSSNSNKTLPSWAFDIEESHALQRNFSGLRDIFMASGTISPRIAFEFDQSILVVRGLVVGVAETCLEHSFAHHAASNLHSAFKDILPLYLSFKQSLEKIRNHLGNTDSTNSAIVAILFEAVSNCAGVFRGRPEEAKIVLELFMERITSSMKSTAEFQVYPGMIESFLDEIRYLYGRKFCITKENRLALVPERTQPQDIVAILLGANRPYVLRPVGDKYILIGDTYIYGLMNGEAFHGPSSKQSLREIRIM